MKIKTLLKQDENDLVTLKPVKLILDKSLYSSDTYQEDLDSKKIWLKSIIANLEFEEKIISLTLDYEVNLYTFDIVENNKKQLILQYLPGESILEAIATAADASVDIPYVERLISGSEIFKDETHIYRKIFDIYGEKSDMDSVHIEVLCSNILRDKLDNDIPARLAKKWDPVLINLKKVVYKEGFIQGLAFENIGEALRSGLISEKETEPSILEKLLLGETSTIEKK